MGRCYSEFDVVPSRREVFPRLRPLLDLTRNVQVAQEIVDRIVGFFKFEDAWPTFSGHARKADRQDGKNPLLYVMMADEGGVYRSFAFRGIGYVGVLYIEDRTEENTFFADYLYAIQYGLNQEGPSPVEGWEERVLGLVCGDELLVSVPFWP